MVLIMSRGLETQNSMKGLMTNVQLVKGMKFPNSKVSRRALREYVIQHHIDIKWKLKRRKRLLYIVRITVDGDVITQW